jgi:xanthine dehydrogenase accessory factor
MTRGAAPRLCIRKDGQNMAEAQYSEAFAAQSWTLPDWPGFGLQSDVRPALAAAAGARASVLATLFASEGPAPLGCGAQMLFDGGAAAGFLSGGCVEGDVALHAQAAIRDGQARRLVYGRGGPPDIHLQCGSRIEVLLERVTADDPAAARLLALTHARRPALWLTDGEQRVCLAGDDDPRRLPRGLGGALELAREGAALSGAAGGAIFRRYDPPPRLVVVGGDPITLAIAQLAVSAGFHTVLVRPKGPHTPPPVAGAAYHRGEPREALGALGLDAFTVVAVATHDLEIDHHALVQALPSPAVYVGALGSRKRLAERVGALRAAGLSDAAIGRLKAPIGLDIGARSPWEIAVSVIAEAVQALRAAEAHRAWPAAAEPSKATA